MGIVVYYYTYYSLVGSTRAYWQGSGRAAARGHFPKAVFRRGVAIIISFSHSTRVTLVHGEWAIKKGGAPRLFGRYGAQRHHFETAHSIRVAPTDFHTEVALSTAHSIRVAPTGFDSVYYSPQQSSLHVKQSHAPY